MTKYQKRVSGPLLDRFDIHIDVPRVDYDKLTSDRMGETSAIIRSRVEAVRQIQRERFDSTDESHSRITCNADMRVAEVRKFCKLDEVSGSLVRAAMSQRSLGTTGCSSWRAQSLIWRGLKPFRLRMWRKHCSIDRETQYKVLFNLSTYGVI